MFSLRDLNQQRSIKRRFVQSWQKEEKAFPQTCPTVHETQKLRRTKNASLLRQGQRVSRRSTSSRRTRPGSGSTSLKLSSKSSTSPSGKAAQIDILSFLEIRRPIQSEVSITKSPKKKNSFRTVAMQKKTSWALITLGKKHKFVWAAPHTKVPPGFFFPLRNIIFEERTAENISEL